MYAADLDTYRMNKKERTDATEKEKELTGKKQFLSHAAKRRNKKDNGSTNTEKLKHKPMNMLLARTRNAPPVDPTTKKCDQCLSEIPLMAKRCAFCAQPV